MSCAQLATRLDIEMLIANQVQIYSASVPDQELPRKSGADVFRELNGRMPLRYIRREDAARYLRGDSNRQCLTPTAYCPDDAISFLNLPDPTTIRTHFLLFQTGKIPEILGPRYVAWGQGIEYILPEGFSSDALANPWPIQIR